MPITTIGYWLLLKKSAKRNGKARVQNAIKNNGASGFWQGHKREGALYARYRN